MIGADRLRGLDEEIDDIRSLARPLRSAPDLDPLLDAVGDARYVLLGEASHGTSEYYASRADLTRRLVVEHGFSFVAVEGDWPDCAMVDRWVKGRSDEASAADVLGRFERWPTWMWANHEVATFLDWLRAHNASTGAQVGFFGLDVYSLWDSLRRVFAYLAEHHPEELDQAIAAYRCFEPYDEDPQAYAWATRMVSESCEAEVVELLAEVRRAALDDAASTGDADDAFDALQNAEVVAGAERYYRTMVRADGESWNVRDGHMADTLDRLMAHHGPSARGVVWAHNTHVGDARATDMARAGMLNLGQLARERHADDGVMLVGFAGHRGSVIAAPAWGDPPRRTPVPPALAGTHEDLLHRALGQPSLLTFPERRDGAWLAGRRGHRAIGVVYEPEAERRGNWVPTVMGERYDALLSFDETDALHPLQSEEPRRRGELETYPWSA